MISYEADLFVSLTKWTLLYKCSVDDALDDLIITTPGFGLPSNLSVYPPVKWKCILDAVNRLPVDVAER